MSARVFTVVLSDKSRLEVPLKKRFCHYVDNVQFWFAIHGDGRYGDSNVLSHWESGMRVAVIGIATLAAARGDLKAAGAFVLDQLIAAKGAARVRSVLAGAPNK